MSYEESFVQKPRSEEEFRERARQTLELIGAVSPEDVVCMTGIVVTQEGESKDTKIHVFTLGSDEDISKMLTTLITVTRDGVIKANIPSNPDSEVTH